MKQPDYILKLRSMRKQVQKEIEDIPRGDSDQNTLRQLYWTYRMRSLGKKPFEYRGKTKEEILRICIMMIQEEEPDFEPKYSKTVFRMEV